MLLCCDTSASCPMPNLIIASNRRHDLISACRCASVQLQSIHSRRFLRQCKRYCWDGTSARLLSISTFSLSPLTIHLNFFLLSFSQRICINPSDCCYWRARRSSTHHLRRLQFCLLQRFQFSRTNVLFCSLSWFNINVHGILRTYYTTESYSQAYYPTVWITNQMTIFLKHIIF